jgi:hypothetical protein
MEWRWADDIATASGEDDRCGGGCNASEQRRSLEGVHADLTDGMVARQKKATAPAQKPSLCVASHAIIDAAAVRV